MALLPYSLDHQAMKADKLSMMQKQVTYINELIF